MLLGWLLLLPLAAAAQNLSVHWEELTGPDFQKALQKSEGTCVLPFGIIEKHGPHLPLDVDIVCPQGIAYGAGKLVPDKLLVLPPVWYGYTGHVMDFPGTINTHFETFIRQVLDILEQPPQQSPGLAARPFAQQLRHAHVQPKPGQ